MSEGPNSFRGAGFIFKTFEDEKEKRNGFLRWLDLLIHTAGT